MKVLITGANRGIGLALYDRYVAIGDDVIGTTRGQAPKNWLQLDVTDPTSVSAMAVRLKNQPLDLLVCNAGVYLDKGNELGNGYDANVWT
ncbi:MAG: SDR family NAD(P)-dependent oxidoreductase, partial [Amylibacter sp.]|nr:SDR family NAD(P)-dependent oxidoreductase [Amylibacter sp.]